MLKYNLQVEIGDIKIDEKYYSFKWKVLIGKKRISGICEEDYDSHTKKEMLKILEKGYALDLVLEKL